MVAIFTEDFKDLEGTGYFKSDVRTVGSDPNMAGPKAFSANEPSFFDPKPNTSPVQKSTNVVDNAIGGGSSTLSKIKPSVNLSTVGFCKSDVTPTAGVAMDPGSFGKMAKATGSAFQENQKQIGVCAKVIMDAKQEQMQQVMEAAEDLGMEQAEAVASVFPQKDTQYMAGVAAACDAAGGGSLATFLTTGVAAAYELQNSGEGLGAEDRKKLMERAKEIADNQTPSKAEQQRNADRAEFTGESAAPSAESEFSWASLSQEEYEDFASTPIEQVPEMQALLAERDDIISAADNLQAFAAVNPTLLATTAQGLGHLCESGNVQAQMLVGLEHYNDPSKLIAGQEQIFKQIAGENLPSNAEMQADPIAISMPDIPKIDVAAVAPIVGAPGFGGEGARGM